MDEKKERRFKKYILIFSILLIVPSIYTLYKSYQKNNFETSAQEFVNEHFEARSMHKFNIDFNEGNPLIEVILLGKAKYEFQEYSKWLENFGLSPKEVKLEISEDTRIDDILSEMESEKYKGSRYFEDNYKVSLQQIKILQDENDSLNKSLIVLQSDTIPFIQISKELKSLFTSVKEFEYGVYKTTDFKTTKEVPTFHLYWKKRTNRTRVEEKKIKAWLIQRLKLNDVRVVSF
tara:strand:- start:545 stop:1243 length:699 start_codon:yes stop_codon:yes gene_type:complete